MHWFRPVLPRSLRVTAALLGLIGLVFGTFQLTLYRAVPELTAAKSRIKTQKAEIRSLASRLEEARNRQLVAEQEASVVRRANQLLRATESNRQAELNRLQTELDFFQRLAGTSGTQPGLAIYHIELSPTGSGRVFHFVLTLTQNLRRSAIISGNVRIDVEGTLKDRLLSLPWSRVTDGNQPEPAFRFKYYQQLEGYLQIPEQFEPSRLLVSLEVKGQSKPVTRSFDWNALTAPQGGAAAKPGPDREKQPDTQLSSTAPH